MLAYDDEAAVYDATRGGQARADAAASALSTLLPATGLVIDVGGGTGIVSSTVTRPDRPVYVIDASIGMLTRAHARLPGHAIHADAQALPLRSASIPAVMSIWLLHLLPTLLVDAVTTDIARVLAPGGVFVSTVNKTAAHNVGSDIDDILGRLHAAVELPDVPNDDHTRLSDHLTPLGLTAYGQATFTGQGQGRTPTMMIDHLTGGRHFTWMPHLTQDAIDTAATALSALPGQDTPRADPLYTLTAWRKHP